MSAARSLSPALSGKPWTDPEMRTLRKLVAEGKDRIEIAQIIGLSIDAIDRKTRTMRLVRPNAGPMAKTPAYMLAGKTQFQYADEARQACILHLVDLRRSFGIGPTQENWEGVALYRTRCEWHSPPTETTRHIPQTWFTGSAYGSPSQMCADQ